MVYPLVDFLIRNLFFDVIGFLKTVPDHDVLLKLTAY